MGRPNFDFPTVGQLPGKEGLSVIVPIGANNYFPWKEVLLNQLNENSLGMGGGELVKILMHEAPLPDRLAYLLSDPMKIVGFFVGLPKALFSVFRYSRGQVGIPIPSSYEAEVYAFDAETGIQQWVFHLPSWPHISG